MSHRMLRQRYPKEKTPQNTSTQPSLQNTTAWHDNAFQVPGGTDHQADRVLPPPGEALPKMPEQPVAWAAVTPQPWGVTSPPHEGALATYQASDYPQDQHQQYLQQVPGMLSNASEVPLVQQNWSPAVWESQEGSAPWSALQNSQQQQPWVHQGADMGQAQGWDHETGSWDPTTTWQYYGQQPGQCFQPEQQYLADQQYLAGQQYNSEQQYQSAPLESFQNGLVCTDQNAALSGGDTASSSHQPPAEVSRHEKLAFDSCENNSSLQDTSAVKGCEGDESTVSMFFGEAMSDSTLPATSKGYGTSGEQSGMCNPVLEHKPVQAFNMDSSTVVDELHPTEKSTNDLTDTSNASPACSASTPDDHVNQEVPEPVTAIPVASGISTEAVNLETVCDDRNQPSVARKAVIKPRQGSPFRPPPAKHSSDPALMQPVPEAHLKQPPLLPLDGSPNMETQPDNLEHPPDTEEVSGQKHVASSSRHKHRSAFFGPLTENQKSNLASITGAALTLLDMPEMPAVVTLVPAAPPLSPPLRPPSRDSSRSNAEEHVVAAATRAPVEGGAAPPTSARVHPQGERDGPLPMTRQSPLGGEEGVTQGRLLVQDSRTRLAEPQEPLVAGMLATSSPKATDRELLQRTEPSGSTDCAAQDNPLSQEENSDLDTTPAADLETTVCAHHVSTVESSKASVPHSRELKDRGENPVGSNQDGGEVRGKARSDRGEDRNDYHRHDVAHEDSRREAWRDDYGDDRKDRRAGRWEDTRGDRWGDESREHRGEWRYDSKDELRRQRGDDWGPEDHRGDWTGERGYHWRDDRSDSWRRRERRDERRPPGYDRREDRHWDDRRLPDRRDPRRPEYEYGYGTREGSRPSSRTSVDDPRLESSGMRDARYPPRGAYQPEDERPPSRHSESNESSPENRRAHWGRHDRYGTRSDDPESYYQQQRHKGKYPANESYDYSAYGRDYYNYYRYGYAPRSGYGYGYYDELYRTNPVYRQQVAEYYAQLGYDPSYFERLSVHSGRSSVNDDSQRESSFADDDVAPFSSYDATIHDGYAESSRVAESTHVPQPEEVKKFSHPHPLARFLGSYSLLKLVPSTAGNVPPLLEIHDLKHLFQKDPQFKELKQFPGPLVRSDTHKNDVIQFCNQKIQSLKNIPDLPDRSSHILLWELLILLLRQNGFVSGTDISELLLEGHDILSSGASLAPPPAPPLDGIPLVEEESSPSPDEGIVVQDRTLLSISGPKALAKFREFLLFGHKKDALDWAMQHGLWGHALSLAAKIDTRTYANVMTHFTSSLAVNDPLQTLYQHLSGRQPTAVTCIADEKWGDWRPHLAMILSNPSSKPHVDARSITTLGDVLASRGCLPAAHFCYLMAQVEFGSYSCKSSKVVLLGSSHTLPFKEFASNDTIQCTEIYEYSQSLANPGFVLPHLQVYKYIHATRLADYGFSEEALHYCEVIAEAIGKSPSSYRTELVAQVYELASRLKYHDPHFSQGQGEVEELGDPAWLVNFAAVLQCHREGLVDTPQQMYGYTEQSGVGSSGDGTQHTAQYSQPDNSTATAAYDQSYQDYSSIPGSQPDYTSFQAQQNTIYEGNVEGTNTQADTQHGTLQGSYQPTQPAPSAWNAVPQVASQPAYGSPLVSETHMMNGTGKFSEQGSPPATMPASASFDYYKASMYTEAQQQQQSSRERLSSISSSADTRETSRRDSLDSSALSSRPRTASGPRQPPPTQQEKSEQDTKDALKAKGSGKSWLGGIFGKLRLRATNEMYLPDDKDPDIVWDEQKKCWVDKTAGPCETDNKVLAPPTDSALQTNKIVQPDGKPSQNKFQMNKRRDFRKNYVDILNPGGSTKPVVASVPPLTPDVAPVTSAPQFFIPQPTGQDTPHSEGFDFVSSPSVHFVQDGSAPPCPENSTSPQAQPPKAVSSPMMFDPAEFQTHGDSGAFHKAGGNLARRKAYPT
ncbi:protein transport protein Sec16A-like isoform X2 [Ornithodoros turicata]|uniref:protein transport protein Sec16A-like isoform X2 n=1 Tax=Ornithodoros turicata TaxID=34597 RepID=UPI00313977DA